MNKEEPNCPYCYDGVIVQDKIADNVFFCSHCKKEVVIKRFEEK